MKEGIRMRNPNELSIEELALKESVKASLREVPKDEILRNAYFGTLASLENIGTKKAEEVLKALREADFIPENYKEVGNALKLYAAVIGGREAFTYEIYTNMVPQLVELLDSCLTKRESSILKMRFGLDGGEPKTLKETGTILYGHDVSGRIREMEIRALRSLRRPYVLEDLDKWRWGVDFYDTTALLQRLDSLNDELFEFDKEVRAIWEEAERDIEALKIQMGTAERCDLRDEIDAELSKRQVKIRPDNPIDELELSSRSYYNLRRAGCDYVIDIIKLGTGGLKSVKNIGKRSFEEVVEKLHENGLKLADE